METNASCRGTIDWQPLPFVEDEEATWEGKSGAAPLNPNQFADAFQQGYPVTLRFLLSRGTPADLAEEVAQAAWVKGWECLGQLQKPEMIGAWVNSIAKNLLKNRMRSENRLERLTDAAKIGMAPVLLTVDVRRMMLDCDERDSRILFGHYLEGYTTEEIAAQVGMTPVTVRVRLLRIRRSLRAKLTKPVRPARETWIDQPLPMSPSSGCETWPVM